MGGNRQVDVFFCCFHKIKAEGFLKNAFVVKMSLFSITSFDVSTILLGLVARIHPMISHRVPQFPQYLTGNAVSPACVSADLILASKAKGDDWLSAGLYE